jgi:hypothetical protein
VRSAEGIKLGGDKLTLNSLGRMVEMFTQRAQPKGLDVLHT